MIDPHNDQPSSGPCATEDKVRVTLRVVSLVALGVGQHLLDIRDRGLSFGMVLGEVLPIRSIPNGRPSIHRWSIYES
jgi:hypothetical protein